MSKPPVTPLGPDTEAPAVKTGRTRGRPRPEEVALLESEMLEVALDEFLQHGYGGASLSRIVKNAGISKGTLYSRYASKAELFRAIVHTQVERLSPVTALQADGVALGLEEGLSAYADHMLATNLEGDLLGVNRLIYSESHRFPELGAAAAERTALGIKRIAHFIQVCAEADGLPCQDPRAIAEAFILMLRGWYVNVILTNSEVSVAQRQRWVRQAVHALVSGRADW